MRVRLKHTNRTGTVLWVDKKQAWVRLDSGQVVSVGREMVRPIGEATQGGERVGASGTHQTSG